jgi:site-specific DNA-methyltransferase (adenine-specific)
MDNMKNEVFLIDCMEYMAGVPDGFFDLAVVDVEYGKKRDKGFSGSDGFRGKGKKIQRTQYKGEWDQKRISKKYFQELFRISKNQMVFGGNYYTDILNPTNAWVVWDKENTMPTYSDGEMIWTSFSFALKIIRYRWNGLLQKNMKNKEIRIHPTQKPVALYKWILQNYAKPGWKIFDSHVGSGSIRIACHDLGFAFTGCELDPDYWKSQEERYQNHIANPELFDKQEIQENIFLQGVLV